MKDKIDVFNDTVQKNLKWNFVMHSLDGIFFKIGVCFSDYGTILPSFVAKMTTSNVLIGLITSIQTIAWFLPQIISAYFTESNKLKKPLVLKMGIGQRLPWLLMAISTLFLASKSPGIALTVFFICFFTAMFSGGIQMPIWMDFVARTMPVNWRGRLFGAREFIGGIAGIGVGVIVAYILEKLYFPTNYTICFMMYFFWTSISYIFVALVREEPYPIIRQRTTFKEYLKNIKSIITENKNYGLFLLSQILLRFIIISSAFYTAYAIKVYNATGKTVATFLSLTVICQSIGMLVLGYIGDHKGHINSLRISFTASITGIVIALISNSIEYMYIVFMLHGFGVSGISVSGCNAIIDFCRPEERPTYIGVTGMMIAPVAGFLPVLAGVVIQNNLFGFKTAFLVSAIVAFTGLMILYFFVKEPRVRNVKS